jgi:hypothetical protein
MAIDFPASPTLNDVFTVGNVTYVWDGTKWTASVTGGISLDKIEEGNTSAEVIDTGSDGRFVVTTEGTERLRVTNTGLVGIGTASPNQALETVGTIRSTQTGSTGYYFRGYRSSTTSSFYVYDDGTNIQLTNEQSGALKFHTANTERVRIDSSGRLGIGTSSPSVSLHVVGGGMFASSTTGGSIVQARNSDFSSLGYFGVEGSTGGVTLTGTLANSTFISSGASGTPLQFGTGGVIRSTLTSTGLGIGTSSPGSPLEVQASSNGGNIANDGIRVYAANRSQYANFGYNGLNATNTLEFGIADSVKMKLDSSGRVGIGTTSPAARLHAVSADNATTSLLSGATNAVRVIGNNTGIGGGTIEGVNAAASAFAPLFVGGSDLRFGISGTERARIDSSGRLLVGTSSAPTGGTYAINSLISVKGFAGSSTGVGIFNISGGMAASSVVSGTEISVIACSDASGNEYATIKCVGDGTGTSGDYPGRLVFSTTADGASSPTERMRIGQNGGINTYTDSANYFAVRNNGTSSVGNAFIIYKGATSVTNGTLCMVIRQDGDLENLNNAYGAYSDIKLKENIVDAASQWDDLKALQVRKYNFKPETGHSTHTQIGLVAQEVELVSPGLVSESPDRDEDGNDLGTVTKSVNYSVLYMKAVKALQEAIAKIETLEGMVAVNNITIDEQQHQLSTLAARLTALESA